MLARGSMFWLWLLLLMIVIQSQKCTGMSPSPLSAPNIEDLSNSAMNTMKFVDYESNAIELIPLVKRNASPQRTYLCTTFIKWSQDFVHRLVFNIHESDGFCYWLIIVYDVDIEYLHGQKPNASQMKHQLLRLYAAFNITFDGRDKISTLRITDIILALNKTDLYPTSFLTHCDQYVDNHLLSGNSHFTSLQSFTKIRNPCDWIRHTSLDGIPFNDRLKSKGSLFALILTYLPHYRYVWVLDGDMSFEGLNLTTLKSVHQCAFETPPYVSQPLINIPTQFYRYLIKRHWEQKGDTLASTVGFIEIQAPLLHAQFLEWYILGFIIPLLPAMHILGADWGLDELFCAAAHEFMLAAPRFHKVNGNTPACAVITANMSLHHDDSGDIRKTVGSELKREINFALMKIVHRYFSSFAFNGLQYHMNPLNRGTNYFLVNKLRDNCFH